MFLKIKFILFKFLIKTFIWAIPTSVGLGENNHIENRGNWFVPDK